MAKRKRAAFEAKDDVQPISSARATPSNLPHAASTIIPPLSSHTTRSKKAALSAPSAVEAIPDKNRSTGEEALTLCVEKSEADQISGRRQKNTTSVARESSRKMPSSDSSLSESATLAESRPIPFLNTSLMKQTKKKDDEGLLRGDPEADGDEDAAAAPEELKEAFSRPPAVNSSYLPLPWKGRLGYACLNTYLRSANPPVFSSRTCRISSILEHRHPLQDPSQPEHATRNRPDKDQPSDIARGQAFVEALGLANARDIVKMLRWNDKYGITFLRLSSEMFPFASHATYGYKLALFASEALADAGRVAGELGHRLTTHPGQFTQLGSPRQEVITASIRDLEYHCELLDLLKLPPQQNRDAVMILHMGGVFGDKAATIQRFKQNYKKLSQSIKNRLVLENDDVCYTVHDILPVCEELNIPLVLDYHHHNILFDRNQLREGTLDIMDLYPRIKATWDRKNIKQKMHYSEPTPGAITARQRRKHSPRVSTLPPCAPDMDLMIEAKDKEQACFELMRTFKLPRYDTFADILPYSRNDENKTWKPPTKKTGLRKKKNQDADESEEGDSKPQPSPIIPDEQLSMGGPDGRVYWPPTMEEWLRPKKRDVKPRDPVKKQSTAEKSARLRAEKAAWQAKREASAEVKVEQSLSTASENGDALQLDTPKSEIVSKKLKRPKSKTAAKPRVKKTITRKIAVPVVPNRRRYDSDSDNPDPRKEERTRKWLDMPLPM